MIQDDTGQQATLTDLETRSDSQHLRRGTTLSRYVIIEPIGSGGMGTVYRAYDPQLNRGIALKLLSVEHADLQEAEKAKARLIREAQALARLSHPNVVAVHDAGIFEDDVFIAMELVEGKTLSDWMSENKKSIQEIISVMISAGRGLDAAHKAGLVHRDFKPGNVIVGDDGRVRVLDFGLARAADQEQLARETPPLSAPTPAPGTVAEKSFESRNSSDSSLDMLQSPLTHAGGILGTPLYMAPEQHLGLRTDERTDLFGFCVVLYEALYGRRPFSATTMEELKKEVIRHQVSIPSRDTDVPSWLWRIIDKGLSVKPEDRYPNIELLLDELGHDPEIEWQQKKTLYKRIALLMALAFLVIMGPLLVWYDLKYGDILDCQQGIASQVTQAWGDESRLKTKKAFLATKVSYAASTWDRAQEVLSKYIAKWNQERTGFCESSWAGAQTDELFHLKIRCLDRRYDEFQKLLAIFARADEKVVSKAIHAATSLSSLSHCLDVNALTSKLEPPHERVAPQVELHQKTLLNVKVLLNTAKYKEGQRQVESVRVQAEQLGYRPLLAEALYWLGSLEDRLGKYIESEKHLQQAYWLAVESEHVEIEALASIRLIWVVGYRLTRTEEGLCWGKSAKASLTQQKWPDRLTSEWNSEIGSVYFTHGEENKALEHYQKALQLEEETLGKEHPKVAVRSSNIGVVFLWNNKHTQALAYFQRALNINKKALGLDHPKVANDLINIGLIHEQQNNTENAFRVYVRALEIWEAALGKNHPKLAWPLAGLGLVFEKQGNIAKASENFRRVTEICQNNICHPQPLAETYVGLAEIRWSQDQNREVTLKLAQKAREAYARAPKMYDREINKIEKWMKNIRQSKINHLARPL